MRGFCGIGVEHSKKPINIGTLWRSAQIYGAAFIFTVGRRYDRQPSDVLNSWRHVPLFHFQTLDALWAALPREALLVGVELTSEAIDIHAYQHPERAVYLLGAEDHGLTKEALDRCHQIVRLPGERSVNVAVAGSIILFDRYEKELPHD
jgi:tRNA G18 (ribose-2'-O)-methylase SpoU